MSAQARSVRNALKSTQSVVDTPEGNYGTTKINGSQIIRDQDGITVIPEGEGPRIPQAGDFDENLAEQMDDAERRSLASRLCEYLEVDRDARKDWYERSKRGLALMGVQDIPEDDENSSKVMAPGQAQVRMPLLAEAATRFNARAMAELFPATGPVKAAPFKKQSPKELWEQADRIETFGNYYLTIKDDGYYPDSDQMLMSLPLAGSEFRKCGQNWVTGLAELRRVAAENFVVPYAAKTLKDAPRYAHTFEMSGQDVRRAMESGMFRTVTLRKPMEFMASRIASDKSDNRIMLTHDDDALYPIAEYHIDVELPADALGYRPGKGIGEDCQALLSYIIIVDTSNEEILMVRRNWKSEDPKCERRIWFAHHKFFPGLGFYGWGYPHLIGSLQKAYSDGVNALLDNAFMNNCPGGFTTKEAKAVGLTGPIEIEPGVFKQLDGTYDELSKSLWTPDFKPASPALAQLVDKLMEAGRSFTSSTEAAVGSADNRGPVGTTLALIEQSNVVPTGIHKRLHFSVGQELRMWAECTHDYMPNVYEYESKGESRQLLKSDFDGRVDIGLVSDPNIWSRQQRLALAQTVIELQTQNPTIYQPAQVVAAHRRMMEAAQIPNMEEVAPQLTQPKYLDPVAENGLIMIGSPVRAYETQDHAAHNAVHEHMRGMVIGSQSFAGMQPEKQQQIMSALDAHIAEHLALGYRRLIMESAGIPLPPLGEDGMQAELDPETEAMITAAVVQQLPPPPPPPQAPQEGQDQAAAIQAKAQADVQAKAMQSQAQIERDTEAFVAEESRKQLAWEAEQDRLAKKAQVEFGIKETAADAEIRRKDVQSATQLVRDGAKAKLQQHAAEAQAQQKLRHVEQSAELDLTRKFADADVSQSIKKGDAELSRDIKQGDADHGRQIKQGEAELDRTLKTEGATQDRTLKDADAKQARRHKASEHAQSTKHTSEQHEITQAHAQEDHENLVERGDKEHKQSLKQSEQSGKLKFQQAKAAAKAKKTSKDKK